MTAAKPPKQQPSTRQLVRAPAAMEQNPPDGLGQRWFAAQGWQPFGFQQEVWQAVGQGRSGLLHATTGAGKTYAVWLAALQRFAAPDAQRLDAGAMGLVANPAAATLPALAKARRGKPPAAALTVLWVTPMRALAADTERALAAPLRDLNLPWTISVRSGDTSSSERQRQSKHLPTVLITTPESLSLLLSGSDAQSLFASLGMVVVDEWHELIGNKRGVQLQLALARLRRWRQGLITWGLSATLGNLEQALEVLVPSGAGLLVQGKQAKTLLIDTLLPSAIERFPWAGHLGLRLLPQVVAAIAEHASSLVFTNTRAQAELWYQALIEARPDWAGLLALHHGSLDRSQRDWVELALKDGRLKAVVCTSSLDLGVDFLPVEQVLQIGSAKGIARLLQRAGRSGHAPGRAARLTLVPTHSLELIEAAAAQDAIASGQIEARSAPEAPLDVLVQHLVTIALGGGFYADELLAEVRSSHAYRSLSDTAWQWALAFVAHGGSSLQAYPDYHRARPNADGLWQVPSAALARRHRMAIGTIVSEATMALRFWSKGPSGKSLGSIEERFIARLKPGDHLLFGGRRLELVRVHEMTAFVRPATGKKAAVPRWSGGRMPLSTALADAMLARMDEAADGIVRGPEMQLAAPLLAVQAQWSALPSRQYLLAEGLHSREGWHLFLYPFAGRNVHLGLASLLALRLGRAAPNTFSIAVNDYGFELLALRAIDWQTVLGDGLFSTEHLLEDVVASLNVGELAQRRFREIARIAGLVFHGYPGAAKSTRQVQASAQLFFEVFQKYDPDNPLLQQARREVLGQELEVDALADTLRAIAARPLRYQALARPSPMAFPLLVERLRETASTEHLSDRIARMVAELEQAADAPAAPRKRMRTARSI